MPEPDCNHHPTTDPNQPPDSIQLPLTLDRTVHSQLLQFKRVFETIIEEEYTTDEYLNTVLAIGHDKMRRDAVQRVKNGRHSRPRLRNITRRCARSSPRSGSAATRWTRRR